MSREVDLQLAQVGSSGATFTIDITIVSASVLLDHFMIEANQLVND